MCHRGSEITKVTRQWNWRSGILWSEISCHGSEGVNCGSQKLICIPLLKSLGTLLFSIFSTYCGLLEINILVVY